MTPVLTHLDSKETHQIKFVLSPSGQSLLDSYLEELKEESLELHAEATAALAQFNHYVPSDEEYHYYSSSSEGVSWMDTPGAQDLDDFITNRLDRNEMRFARIGLDWDNFEVIGTFRPADCELHVERVIVMARSEPKFLDEPREPLLCPECHKTGPFDIRGHAWFRIQGDNVHPTHIECGYSEDDECLCKSCDRGCADDLTVGDLVNAAKKSGLS